MLIFVKYNKPRQTHKFRLQAILGSDTINHERHYF
nr:MAG TPA: hypothetical protein [Caudoviricetes sp.]